MSYDKSQVCFTDTESLGLDPDRHMLWEVAVIVDDVEHVWQIAWPASVRAAADPVALEINHFEARSIQLAVWNSDDLVRGTLLTPKQSVLRFAELSEGRHLVGAVVSFDEERLRRMHVNVLGMPDRFPWHYHICDVEAMAIGYLQARNEFSTGFPWKSDDLSAALGVITPEGEERHTALADARWARSIFEAVME